MQGFDEEGNVFSSVSGLTFDWKILNPQFIKQVRNKESLQKYSDQNDELENKKLFSDTFFVKGLKPGVTKISVRLIEPGYENVKET